jgi:hypothetical protein
VKKGFELLAGVLREIRDSLAVVAAASSVKIDKGVETVVEGEASVEVARESGVIVVDEPMPGDETLREVSVEMIPAASLPPSSSAA